MKPTITDKGDGTQCIHLDYQDEGIELVATTTIIGDADRAAAYVSVFDADIRRIDSHLFPQPEPTETEYTKEQI
ncbi:hypothetical protein RZS08_23895 [Arthrospira platensis SPKY1]|nr:hypothetical protein [Arthrospira platensis SPKY1]